MPTALEDASFVQNARDSGYNDDEIYAHLAEKNPAFGKMKEAGYAFPEVYQHIYDSAQKQSVGMREATFGPTTPVGSMMAEARGDLQVEKPPTPPSPAPPSEPAAPAPPLKFEESPAAKISPEQLASARDEAGTLDVGKLKKTLTPQQRQEGLKGYLEEVAPGKSESIIKATQPGSIAALGSGLYTGADPLQTLAKTPVATYAEAAATGFSFLNPTVESPFKGMIPDLKESDLEDSSVALGPLGILKTLSPSSRSATISALNMAKNKAEELGTPFNVALAGMLPGAAPAVQKAVSGAFTVQMAAALPQKIAAAAEAQTPAERGAAYTDLALDALFIGSTFAHAAGRTEKLPPGITRPSGLSEKEAQTLIREANSLRTLYSNSPAAVLDPMVQTRDALRDHINSTGQASPLQRDVLAALNNQLANVPGHVIAQSRSRIEEQRLSTAPAEATAPAGVEGSPPAETGTSPLFRQAQDEAAKVVAPLVESADKAADVAPATAAAAKEAAAVIAEKAVEPAVEEPVPSVAEETPTPAPVEQPPVAAEEQPAPAPEPGTRIVGPAIIGPDGKLIAQGKIGDRHINLKDRAKADAIKKGDEDAELAAIDAKHVFVDDKGNILNREQAWELAEKAGQISPEALAAQKAGTVGKELHSENLVGEAPAVETAAPTVEEPVAAEATKPTPAPARKFNAAKIKDVFGEEEEAPALAPVAAEAPKPTIDKAEAESATRNIPGALGDAVRDVLLNDKTVEEAAADNGTTVAKVQESVDRMQKYLADKAAKAKPEPAVEPSSVPTVEPITEKELWQKTRDEVSPTEKAKHRLAVRKAVSDGQPVPLEVLEDFKGSAWADKAREEMYGQQISDTFLAKILKGLSNDPTAQLSDPLFIQSVGKPVLRAAVRILQESIEAGKLAGDALSDAMGYLREHIPNLNEEKANEFFDQFFEEETPREETTPSQQPGVEAGETREDVPTGEAPRTEAETEVPPPVEEGGDTTALKRAVVDEQARAEGRPVIPTESNPIDDVVVAQAKAQIDADPTLAKKLISQIVDEGKTGVTRLEVATLLAERRRMRNERKTWEDIAGDDKATSTERGNARAELARMEEEQYRLDQASRTAGRGWSDVGRIMQREIREDFTLEALERKARVKNHGPLSGEERAKLSELAKKYEEAEKERDRLEKEKDELEKQASEGSAFEEMARIYEDLVNEVQSESKPSKTPASKKAPLSQSVIDFAKSQREAALERIRQRKERGEGISGAVGGSGVPKGRGRKIGQKPIESNALKDYSIVGASYIMEGVAKGAKWAKMMVDTLGEEVRPFLKEIRTAAEEQVENLKKQAEEKPKTVRKAKAKLQADAVAGDPLDPKALADAVRAYIREGLTGENEVMAAVHQDIAKENPNITERQVRQALVKYGSEVKKPNRDAVETRLRQLKSLVKIEEDIQRLTEKKKTWKSQVRDKRTQELRDKIKVRSNLLKQTDIPETEESLASRAQTRITALENRIADINRELETGQRPPEGKAVTRTPREEDLMMLRDALQEKLNEVRRGPGPTEADLAADKAQKAVDRAAAALDRQQRINSGEITPEAKEKVQPLTELEKELRDRTEELRQAKRDAEKKSPAQKQLEQLAKNRDRLNDILSGKEDPSKPSEFNPLTQAAEDMKAEIIAMRELAARLKRDAKPKADPNYVKEQAQIKALEKAIAEYDRRIREKDFSSKGKVEGPATQKVQPLKDLRDARKKAYDALKKADLPVRTPEEIYNETRMKQVKKQIEDAEAKLAEIKQTGKYTPKPKPAPKPKFAETAKAEAKLEEIKQEIYKNEERISYEKTSPAKKIVQAIGDVVSGIKVAGHGTVGMITHAGGLLYRPSRAGTFWKNFGRQFSMLLKPEVHEQLIYELKKDPEFETWKNAGASIDPGKTYTDYGLYNEALEKLSEKGGKVGKTFAGFLKGGARAFDVLKLTRLELNKADWAKVPEEIKADPEQAALTRKYIAALNNKATGAIPTKLKFNEESLMDAARNKAADVILFAPRLYASRWARVVLDPVKTLNTLVFWKSATPAERFIATKRVKNAAEFAATYVAALATNQAILSATGSNQKVNLTDPSKKDWLKFKGGGMEMVADGGLLDPIRLLGQVVIADRIADRTANQRYREGSRFDKAGADLWKYLRGKFSPAVGFGVDLFYGADFAGRPLPFSNEPPKFKDQPKYTWGEWLLQQGPIPLAGGTRVAYDELRKNGFSHLSATQLLKLAASSALGLTGAHVSDDYEAQKKPYQGLRGR